MKKLPHLIWVLMLVGVLSACDRNDPNPQAPAGQFTYGTAGNEFASGIVALPNGQGFLLVGGQKSETDGSYDMYLIQADANGNEVFTKNFGTPDADEVGWKILQNQAGEYVIFGTKTNSSEVNGYFQMTFLDANFDIIRQEETENADLLVQNREVSFLGAKIYEMDGGGYFVAGTMISSPVAIVIAASGSVTRVEYYNEFECPKIGEFMTKRPDGGFAMALQFQNNAYNSDIIPFVMFDAAGNYQTETFVRTTSLGNYPYAIQAFSDSTYRIYTRSNYDYINHIFHVGEYLDLILESDLDNATDYAMLRETSNGRVFAAGYDGLDPFVYSGSNSENAKFKLLGSDHREISETERGGLGMERIYDMIPTSDGKYAAVGITKSFGAGASDAYLILIED